MSPERAHKAHEIVWASPALWVSSIVSYAGRSVTLFTAHNAEGVMFAQVLNIVADRIPQILKMNVPVPDHIPFYMDKVIPEDHDRQTNNETQLSKPAAPHPIASDFELSLHAQQCPAKLSAVPLKSSQRL